MDITMNAHDGFCQLNNYVLLHFFGIYHNLPDLHRAYSLLWINEIHFEILSWQYLQMISKFESLLRVSFKHAAVLELNKKEASSPWLCLWLGFKATGQFSNLVSMHYYPLAACLTTK